MGGHLLHSECGPSRFRYTVQSLACACLPRSSLTLGTMVARPQIQGRRLWMSCENHDGDTI